MGNDSEIAHVEDSNSQLDVDTIDYASPEIQKNIRVLNDPEFDQGTEKLLTEVGLHYSTDHLGIVLL
jgi:hypothetical protein